MHPRAPEGSDLLITPVLLAMNGKEPGTVRTRIARYSFLNRGEPWL